MNETDTQREEDRENFGRFMSIPQLGIQFRRNKANDLTILCATWRDKSSEHIYEVRITRDGNTPNCGWRAAGTTDGHFVFSLSAKGRNRCEHLATAAMKQHIRLGHRKTLKKLKALKKEGK